MTDRFRQFLQIIKTSKLLTPNALLKGTIEALLPLDVFVKADGYKQSWSQIGSMSDEFWRQWLRSYLPAFFEMAYKLMIQ